MTSTLVNPSGVQVINYRALNLIRDNATYGVGSTCIGELGFVVRFTIDDRLREEDEHAFRNLPDGSVWFAVIVYSRAGFIVSSQSNFFASYEEARARARG